MLNKNLRCMSQFTILSAIFTDTLINSLGVLVEIDFTDAELEFNLLPPSIRSNALERHISWPLSIALAVCAPYSVAYTNPATIKTFLTKSFEIIQLFYQTSSFVLVLLKGSDLYLGHEWKKMAVFNTVQWHHEAKSCSQAASLHTKKKELNGCNSSLHCDVCIYYQSIWNKQGHSLGGLSVSSVLNIFWKSAKTQNLQY